MTLNELEPVLHNADVCMQTPDLDTVFGFAETAGPRCMQVSLSAC